MSKAVLQVSKVTQRFDGLVALSDVSTEISEGEVVGITGPNGTGKMMLFDVITGTYCPTEGKVFMLGKDMAGWKSHGIARVGSSKTLQNVRLFPKMTVLGGVLVGMHINTRTDLPSAIFNTKAKREEERQMEERAGELLRLLGLYEARYKMSASLPYRDQRKLEIARALATQPKLLLLDRPAAGVNKQETKELLDIVIKLKQMDYTVLLIEHDVEFAMDTYERIYVLDSGTLTADGVPEKIRSSQAMIETYLGKEG